MTKNLETTNGENKNSESKNPKFGGFMNEMRKRLGISQGEAAKRIGISLSYLAQLEASKRNPPSHEIVRKIAHAYAVDEKTMLDRAGYGESPKTGIAPERIEWAFNTICTDPSFQFGHKLRHKTFDLETKAFLVECYTQNTGRMLLSEGATEGAGLEDAHNALEARLEAALNHLKPQIRNWLREWTLETPSQLKQEDEVLFTVSIEGTTEPPVKEDNLPVRRIRRKDDEAAAVPNRPLKPAPAKRKMKMPTDRKD